MKVGLINNNQTYFHCISNNILFTTIVKNSLTDIDSFQVTQKGIKPNSFIIFKVSNIVSLA